MKSIPLAIVLLLMFSLIQCRSDKPKNGPESGNSIPITRLPGDIQGAGKAGTGVSFATSDNVVIKGTLYEAGKSGAPAVLCLHQWRGDRSGFGSMPEILQSEGFTVLAIDMRGNGESKKKSDGSTVAPDRDAVRDVAAAMDFLKKQKSVDPSRIGILGASYGGSNAVLYAANNGGVKALCLMSPGLNYFNVLPIEPAMKKLQALPILAVASSEDVRSVEALDTFKGMKLSGLSIQKYDNLGHGTDMLGANTGLEKLISGFFSKNL